MAVLVHKMGDQQQEFRLGELATLGRHPENTINIHDPVLSGRHAEIRRTDDGRYVLADLGSRHGTWVRGTEDPEFKRVPERVLSDGDEIIVGSTQLAFNRTGMTLDTRRWSMRTSCRLPVRIGIEPGKTLEATVTDIGQGGMRIDLEQQLEQDSIVDLSISFPGTWKRLRLKARVTHSSTDRGLGVAFVFPSDRVRTKLMVQIGRLLTAEDKSDSS